MEKVKSKCSINALRRDGKKKPLAKVTQVVPTASIKYLSTGLTLIIDLCGKTFGWVMQKVLSTC